MASKYENRCPACQSPASVQTSNGGVWDVDCTRCGIFQIDDFAEGILRDHPKTLEQIANISGFIRENSGMVINQDLTDSLFELPTPSLEQKTLRLFLRIAKEFPRPGTSFSINYWGAEMVLGKILDNKEETFDEKFIAMFQDILPWLSYGWIVNGQELAYVVQRTLQDNYGFLEKGLASGDLCITPAGWSFLDRLKKSATPNSSAQDPKERSVKGDEMNSDDKEKQTAGSMVFHIGSVQGNVGNVSNSQVNFNDYRSVHQLLMDHNITKQDRRELEDIMDELKTAPPEKKSSWVERGEKWFVSHKEALGACAEIIRKALGLGTEPPTK